LKSTFYPAVRSVKQQGSAEFYSAYILARAVVAKIPYQLCIILEYTGLKISTIHTNIQKHMSLMD